MSNEKGPKSDIESGGEKPVLDAQAKGQVLVYFLSDKSNESLFPDYLKIPSEDDPSVFEPLTFDMAGQFVQASVMELNAASRGSKEFQQASQSLGEIYATLEGVEAARSVLESIQRDYGIGAKKGGKKKDKVKGGQSQSEAEGPDVDERKESAAKIARDAAQELQRIAAANADLGINPQMAAAPNPTKLTPKRIVVPTAGIPVELPPIESPISVDITADVPAIVEPPAAIAPEPDKDVEPSSSVTAPALKRSKSAPSAKELEDKAKNWEKARKRSVVYLRTAFELLEKAPFDRAELVAHFKSSTSNLQDILKEDAYPFIWNEGNARKLSKAQRDLFNEAIQEALGKVVPKVAASPAPVSKDVGVKHEPEPIIAADVVKKAQAWESSNKQLAHRLRGSLMKVIKDLSALSADRLADDAAVIAELRKDSGLMVFWQRGEADDFVLWVLGKKISPEKLSALLDAAAGPKIIKPAKPDRGAKPSDVLPAVPVAKTTVSVPVSVVDDIPPLDFSTPVPVVAPKPVVPPPASKPLLPKNESKPDTSAIVAAERAKEKAAALAREKEERAQIEHKRNELRKNWEDPNKRLLAVANIVRSRQKGTAQSYMLSRCEDIGVKLRRIHDNLAAPKPDLEKMLRHETHLVEINRELKTLEEQTKAVDSMRQLINDKQALVVGLLDEVFKHKEFVKRNRYEYVRLAHIVTQQEDPGRTLLHSINDEVKKLDATAGDFGSLNAGLNNIYIRLEEMEKLFKEVILKAQHEPVPEKGFLKKLFS